MGGTFSDNDYLHVEELPIHVLKQGDEVFLVKAGRILVFREKHFIANGTHDTSHKGNGYFQPLFSQQFEM
jgi:hypothetical protein